MSKISRRKFIEKALILNGSVLFGASWLSPGLDHLLLPSAIDYFLPIQDDNPAIVRLKKKCKGCRDCIAPCAEKQKVYGTYKSSNTHHVCIHCGSCIMACDRGALTEKFQWREVFEAIDDPSKVVIASVSPSVPVGIGDYFGMAPGSFLLENTVGACRALGFDYVLDTNFSADLTIMEEANELQKLIKNKGELPLFTSCCPAWVKYVEIFYPSLLSHLSTVRSPVIMQGSMVKSYFAMRNGIDARNIVHVAITPCTAKKYEVTRDELTINDMRSTDFALTTNELAMMLNDRKINLTEQRSEFDSLMGTASGGGIIFGSTGGVMRAALRTAHHNITGKSLPAELLELKQIQGLAGLREAVVPIGSTSLNVAVCNEMRNAKIILDQVMNGTCKYDFVEVMACQGGCVGGAGQPPRDNTNLEERINALNVADSQAFTRYSHENPEIKAIYRNFLGKPGGKRALKYLHTAYFDKSHLLEPGLLDKKVAVGAAL